MTTGPIFVVGASRSGTSLARSVLNQHPDVHVAGETHYFDDLRTRGDIEPDAVVTPAQRQACEDYFLALAARPYGHGGDPADSPLSREDLRSAAHDLGDTPDAYFEAFCRLHARVEGATTAPRWGEKTPRHVFRLPEMLARYPDAQVVAMVRDPRAVVASYRDWQNRGGLDLDEDYRRALTAEQARARASYDPTVATLVWRSGVTAALRARASAGAQRVRLQRYENLVADPPRAVADLCAFLGLDYDDELLAVPMHNSSFSTFDPSSGVSTAAVDRWRERLSEPEIGVVQFWSRRHMERFGYPPDAVDGPRVPVVAAARGAVGAVRAVAANRDRTGNLPAYVLRRLRALVSPR